MLLQLVTYIILLTLLVLGVRVYKQPGIAAALVWSMIVLESVVQQGNSFLLQNSRFMNYAVGLLAAGAAGWAIVNHKYRNVSIPRQVWLYAALIGFCMVSIVWTMSPEFTVERRNKQLPYIIAWGFLAPMCVFDERQLAAAIKTTIYFGALIVLANVLSETGRRGIILDRQGGVNIEANPLAAATYSGYVALACLFTIWGKRMASFQSILKVGIILLCLVNMIKSGSRGQLVAFSLVSVFWLPIMTKGAAKRSILGAAAAMIAAIALVLLTIYMVDALGWKGRWDFQQLVEDGKARLDAAWFMLETNFREGPLYWIVGLGTSSSFRYLDGTYPHNIYMETLAEEGVIGLLLLGSIIFLSLKHGYSMMKSDRLDAFSREHMGILVAIFSFNLVLAGKQGTLLGSAANVFCMALTIAWMHSRYAPLLKMQGQPLIRYRQVPNPNYQPNATPRSR